MAIHIPIFKMLTIRQVWSLVQEGDYAFSVDLKDAYLHIAIVKHHFCFYRLTTQTLSMEGFVIWAGYSPKGFPLTH